LTASRAELWQKKAGVRANYSFECIEYLSERPTTGEARGDLRFVVVDGDGSRVN
jgi:hypothetical protein